MMAGSRECSMEDIKLSNTLEQVELRRDVMRIHVLLTIGQESISEFSGLRTLSGFYLQDPKAS